MSLMINDDRALTKGRPIKKIEGTRQIIKMGKQRMRVASTKGQRRCTRAFLRRGKFAENFTINAGRVREIFSSFRYLYVFIKNRANARLQ